MACRKINYRRPRIDAGMNRLADEMLARAQFLFDASADLDTAVRDVVSEGLAFIVYAAYDTQAVAQCVSDLDCAAYIQQKTYLWFRDHEFVEWFCVGASTLFKTSSRCFFRVRQKKNKGATILTHEKVG
jgi:hypothetical protein